MNRQKRASPPIGFTLLNRAQAVCMALALVACGGGGDNKTDPLKSVTSAQMQPPLSKARGAGPGLAAALVSSQSVLLAADGKGSVANSAALNTNQWFHLGSNGKSITAMASTILTARRQLSWPVEAGNEFH